jgi:hypothetical protein
VTDDYPVAADPPAGSAASARRPRFTRARRIAAVIAVLAVVVYGTVVTLYALSDGADAGNDCPRQPPTDAVLMQLQPESVDAASDRIVVNLSVRGFGPVADPDSELSTADLTLYVTGNDGTHTFSLPAGEIPSPLTVRFVSEGDVERWPFDQHTATTTIAVTKKVAAGIEPVLVQLCGQPHVPGWVFASTQRDDADELVINGTSAEQLQLTAHRSSATIVFGLVILTLMIVLPAFALVVAILAFRGRRKVEATLTSWFAAMLFATIPLRNFLPGSPPIGSWVDYLVVLWVLVGLVAALVIYVLAWLKWTPAPDGPPPPR